MYKNGIPKNHKHSNTLETVGRKVPKVSTKKWIEVHDHMQMISANQANK